jgi:nucleoside-diphosphate-sugar epimerase
MKTILVTGALGHIGVFLTEYLEKLRYNVIGSDVMMKDADNYVRADITSFEDLYRIFKRNSIDAVIHMGAEVGRMRGEEYPQKMVYVNDVGTINVVKLCIDYGTKLVYFSTSEVYGRLFDDGHIVIEEDLEKGSAFTTTNVYAMSKLFGEAIVRHHVENYDLNAVTIRPFMIYGPGEYPSKYRTAICNFVYQALTGQKITVHRGAERAWCYIDDFVEGVQLVMNTKFPGKYEAYNLGSDEIHTMEEVARIIIEEANGSEDQVELVDPPSQFMSLVKRFSIDKVRKLGYQSRVSLKKGVHSIVEWQKKEVLGY